MSWYDTVLQESMLPTDSRNSRKIQRIPSNQEFENFSITIDQDKCLFKNQEKESNTTKEKIQNNTIGKNSEISSFEKSQNKAFQKISSTNNIIKIWQDPKFLRSEIESSTRIPNNNLECKIQDITFLGSNAMNFPSKYNLNINNPIRESFKNIAMKMDNQTDILNFNKTLKEWDIQMEKNNHTTKRKYSFCYGHIPYTALFKVFASQDQTTINKTGQELLDGDTTKEIIKIKQQSKNTATILEKIAKNVKESTTQSRQNQILKDNNYTSIVPDIGFPWKPRNRLVNQQFDIPHDENTSLTKEKSPDPVHQPKFKNINKEDKNNYSNILQDDNRSFMDQKVDGIHDFNDYTLQSNGFEIASIMRTDMNAQIYAGTMITEIEPEIFMYICKACDMVGFDQTNILIHFATPKHQDNTKIWIQQHYILYEPTFSPNNKEPTIDTYKKSLQGSNAGWWFNDMMEVIGDQTLFPTQHKVNVAFLITKFFTATQKMDIKFIPSFTNAKDSQGQSHWIISAFEEIQQRHHNTRQYLKENSLKNNLEIIIKSPAQKMEIETIADLARLLFRLLVECDFIPTNYLILLAIIMCEKPKLEYPESKSKLFNGHYVDLLLEEGAFLLTKEEKISQKKDNRTNQDIHTKQKINEDFETNNQQGIQILTKEQYEGFMEYCNSKTWDWKFIPIQRFRSKIKRWHPEASHWSSTQIWKLRLHMQYKLSYNRYINYTTRKQKRLQNKSQTLLPTIPRNEDIEQFPFISRDVKDGNYPNYCQSPNYTLMTSRSGSLLCNYCGLPSHKRQNCLIKRDDRKIGLTRIDHPDKDKYIKMQEKRTKV